MKIIYTHNEMNFPRLFWISAFAGMTLVGEIRDHHADARDDKRQEQGTFPIPE